MLGTGLLETFLGGWVPQVAQIASRLHPSSWIDEPHFDCRSSFLAREHGPLPSIEVHDEIVIRLSDALPIAKPKTPAIVVHSPSITIRLPASASDCRDAGRSDDQNGRG